MRKAKTLQTIFEEKIGGLSLMRVQSFLTLLFTFGYIIYYSVKGFAYLDLLLLTIPMNSIEHAQMIGTLIGSFVPVDIVLILLVAAFVPKALQKFAEAKLNKTQLESQIAPKNSQQTTPVDPNVPQNTQNQGNTQTPDEII